MILPTGVIAHRGASQAAPENTHAAFVLAHDMGATWIETDVMLTLDGVPILHHDDSLKRTTGVDALVAQTKYDSIKQLDAGSWFSPQYASARIPTLHDTLIWAHKHQVKFNLEIKPTVGTEVQTATLMMDMLKRHGVHPDEVLISSFSLKTLEVAQKRAPEYHYGWLAHNPQDLQVGLQSGLTFATMNLNVKFVDQTVLADLKSRGYAVLVYTCNDPVKAKHLLSLGVKAVFSDNPALLKS